MSCYQLNSSLGFSVTKLNNVDLIEDDKLIFIVGNTVQILNIKSTENSYGKFNDDHIVIHGHANGIGAFAIHPNKQYFAFGEIGASPDIYIYDYPQLKQQQKLSNGTQRKYNDMEFNVSGNYLATIGASPDHMLTIWDWKLGTVILRAKAFSQDVFNVRFSAYNQNRLITSGTGHIRFWEMAQTFTGLKLQGKIGKFGEIDLSDVWSFVEFPCGKILSGSEHGNILMWQSDLIQFVAKPNDDEPCHQSNIIYVDIVKHSEDESMTLISADSDGFIKFWECDDIEYFEASDDLTYYPLQLKHEIKVNANAKCKLMSIIKYKDLYWIIQDAMGNLYKLSMNDEYTLRSVLQFHGLYVTSIACGNKSHDAVTSGKDGTIRHWNLETQRCDFMKQIQSPVNAMLPLTSDKDKTCFVVFCEDGVVRVIEEGTDSFLMKYSLRIHDEAIVYAAISNNSQYLATVTEKQLFFCEIINRHHNNEEDIMIEPIGFVSLKEKLNEIYWSADNNTLYSYRKQDIVTYQRPNAEELDTTSSFEIELTPTIVRFTPLWTEEDTKADEDASKSVEKKAEEKGEESQTKDKKGEEEKAKEKEKEKENIFDDIEWEISCILPSISSDTDVFIAVWCPNVSVSIPNYYKWNISEHKIIEFHATHLEHDDVINRLSYSNSKQFVLLSSQQSMIQIRDINEDHKYANIRIHSGWDSRSKSANLMAISFDNRLLLSSSSDGSLFCHLLDPNKLKHPDGLDENFDFDYIACDADTQQSIKHKHDIKDHTATDYSVQGEKIQRELDSAKSAAERYKTELREQLNKIRSRKEGILERAKPFISQNLGLSLCDLDIDTNLRSTMNQKLERDVKQMKDEMAWESAKIDIGLNKLEDAFLNTVTVENIDVSSFRSNHTISTFRTPVLPEWVERDIAKVHRIINAETQKAREMEARNTTTTIQQQRRDEKEENDNDEENEENNGTNDEEDNDTKKEKGKAKGKGQPDIQRLSASKQKKMIREKLKNALEELQQEKPDENADDPRDIEAIHFATRNIGDYKLKSDSNYVVPEDAHINASQKRKQMILLLESVNYIKMGLNERVLALRDLKKRIIENITNDTLRLNEINRELQNGMDTIAPPTMDRLKEWPQQRYHFTQKDLTQFQQLLQKESEDKSGTNNAFGGGGGGGGNNGDDTAKQQDKKQSEADDINIINSGYLDRLNTMEPSQLESEELMTRRAILEYESRVLLDKINSTMDTFDMAVSELREEKYKLMNDLKLTDLKFLTLLKELKVLHNFEDREICLNGKLLKCRTEKAQVVVDLTETQERLSSKLEEIRLWQEKDEKIMSEFDRMVGERNPFYDELKKIFVRKIKRNRRDNTNNGGGGGESDGDSDSDSSYDSSMDSTGGGDATQAQDAADATTQEDCCPKDCDNLIYEKVMELREKRLDQEEILIEFEAAVHALKSQNISLMNKEKSIDKHLCETEKEIELFQTEKQQFLNQIIVTVPLLLSQIRLKNSSKLVKLPSSSIDDLLIFELKSLDNLKKRISQQAKEKIEIKKEYTELKKLHKLLTKKINIKQSNIDVEKRKCEQVQFLKYGRLVSLEVLDANNNTNQETQQLKLKVEKITKEYKKKLNAAQSNVMKTKKELKELIIENTKNIQIVTKLKSQQNNLGTELNKILDVDVIKDTAPADRKRNHQLQKLVQVAKTQANEIDVLKAEIHMLQRKGGVLYAMPEV